MVEQHVSHIAEHLFADKTTVTPASVAQMLQSLPNVWISAATYDLAQTALEMKRSPEKFASLVPKLLSERANLRLFALAPRRNRKDAEPVITALVLHHLGADLPRIIAPTKLPKRLAEVLALLEEARRVRILAQTRCQATCTDTDRESLRMLKRNLKLQLKNVFDHDNVFRQSLHRVFVFDVDQLLSRVWNLLTRDLELIDCLACPRSQTPEASV